MAESFGGLSGALKGAARPPPPSPLSSAHFAAIASRQRSLRRHGAPGHPRAPPGASLPAEGLRLPLPSLLRAPFAVSPGFSWPPPDVLRCLWDAPQASPHPSRGLLRSLSIFPLHSLPPPRRSSPLRWSLAHSDSPLPGLAPSGPAGPRPRSLTAAVSPLRVALGREPSAAQGRWPQEAAVGGAHLPEEDAAGAHPAPAGHLHRLCGAGHPGTGVQSRGGGLCRWEAMNIWC